MINIKFPNTNLVECVFSYRQGSNVCLEDYDERDHFEGTGARKLKRYVYALPEKLVGEVHVGDAVLVHCATGYQVCEVVSINATSPMEPAKIQPVICKLDLSSYFEEIERKGKLAALKQMLQAEKKRLESMITYELLAEKNPGFKELLDAFKELGGEL